MATGSGTKPGGSKPPSTSTAPNSNYRHLGEFSKALASEVRILLQEIGELRDQRRALQYEIAQLMALKSQHGPGGEFYPESWKPIAAPPSSTGAGSGPSDPIPASSESGGSSGPVRSGWKVVHQPRRVEKKKKVPKAITAPMPPVPLPPPSEPSASGAGRAWASWKPNPNINPNPTSKPAPAPIDIPQASNVGIFGPDSPK